MEENTDASKPYVGFPEMGRSKKKSYGAFALVILAVIIAAFFVYSLVWGGETKDTFMKDGGEVSQEEEVKVEASPTPEVVMLDKKDIKVSILNGSGIAGSASVLQKKIESLGFSNIETGNAESYDFKTTQVLFGSSVSKTIREELIRELEKTYTTVDSEEKTVSGFDIQITIGGASSKVTGTPTPTTVKSTPTPTKATSPTPSSSPTVTPTI